MSRKNYYLLEISSYLKIYAGPWLLYKRNSYTLISVRGKEQNKDIFITQPKSDTQMMGSYFCVYNKRE